MAIFDTISGMLTNALGPFGPIIFVGGLGVTIVLAAIVLMMQDKNDPMAKLSKVGREGAAIEDEKTEKLRRASANEKLAKYKGFLEPQNAEELSSIQLKLLQAGYQSRDAVRAFYLAQFALGIIGLILGVGYYITSVDPNTASTQSTLMYVLGPGGVGYFIPKYWITRRVAERQEEIINGFPDSLDMMLVCVEAGQSLDQAIVRVAAELQASYPALALEYEIVAQEMKAGKDKSVVLNDMAERCGVLDVSSFVTVMNQSQSFGTPIADALRVYSAEMRDKRVMRAEEAANKLPTKMTLATMMLTVPPLLLILVSPSAMNIAKLGG